MRFELSIYTLIVATVIVGIVQTIPGRENFFSWLEWVAVGVFTVEYVLRFIGCGADPEFSGSRFKRFKFIVNSEKLNDIIGKVRLVLSSKKKIFFFVFIDKKKVCLRRPCMQSKC